MPDQFVLLDVCEIVLQVGVASKTDKPSRLDVRSDSGEM